MSSLMEIRRFVTFCFVGGTSALIHLIIFNIFFYLLAFEMLIGGISLNFILSTIIAIFISVIYNFTMNKNITFSAKSGKAHRQFVKFLILYSGSIFIGSVVNFTIISLVEETILTANIATIAGTLASIPISFFGSKFWVFRKEMILLR